MVQPNGLRLSNQEGKHTSLAWIPHSALRSYKPSPKIDLGLPPLLVASIRGSAGDELASSVSSLQASPLLPAPRAPRTPAPPSPLRGEDLVRVSVPSPGVKVNPTSGTPACLQALSSPPVPAPRAPQRRKQRLRQLQTLVADTQLAGGEGRCP